MVLEIPTTENGSISGLARAHADSLQLRSIPKAGDRYPFLDFLRAVASQLIVWHHLSYYGPLPDSASSLAPRLLEWLVDYARMVVQVFFVLGGFFTARSLTRGKVLSGKFIGTTVWQRYRRIGFPYLVTLVVAVGANALARQWMQHEAISEPPTVGQLLAHATFLHNILGYEALTAGIWYLAIDFQLFILSLLTFAAAQAWMRHHGKISNEAATALALKLLAPLALASLFWFNRHPKYDVWAIYFVGSYFLGIVLHELLANRLKLSWAASYFAVVLLAVIIDPRPRLVVAAGTALIVYASARTGLMQTWPQNRVINYFGRISYSLFLIHFPVLLVVNAWGAVRFTGSPGMAWAGLWLAYGLSVLAGIALYHGVESRVR